MYFFTATEAPSVKTIWNFRQGFGLQVQKPDKARDGTAKSLALKPFVRFDVCKRPSIFSSPQLRSSELWIVQDYVWSCSVPLAEYVSQQRSRFHGINMVEELQNNNEKGRLVLAGTLVILMVREISNYFAPESDTLAS
ncbi:hypothetical protein L2E82_22374 [Cichorium intybus]|uniref:Uncharacterized protein n=1 Tax=Cichorium intybus TaxID=13427 RepID=A0ACB9DXL4_CICIN|nr:hypothetical protein L2E82_22374 [Cichorium intybus]